MKDKKYADDDPERTLITLDQLSQTIEVMTSVVNRLRRHLSDQIKAQLEAQEELGSALSRAEELAAASIATEDSEHRTEDGSTPKSARAQDQKQNKKRESFVVEINQQEIEPVRKTSKVLH